MKSRLESILRSTFYRRPRLLLLLGAAIVVWIATCKPKHDPLGVVPPPTEEPAFVPTPDSLLPKGIVDRMIPFEEYVKEMRIRDIGK